MNDRPKIELSLSVDGLTIRWGPKSGPWGIFNANMIASPDNVSVTDWWLMVGTKAKPDIPQLQPNQPQLHQLQDLDDEPIHSSIFNQSVGTETQKTIPRDLLPLNQLVLARVIGFFDSKNETNDPIVEGIYSNVARQQIH